MRKGGGLKEKEKGLKIDSLQRVSKHFVKCCISLCSHRPEEGGFVIQAQLDPVGWEAMCFGEWELGGKVGTPPG